MDIGVISTETNRLTDLEVIKGNDNSSRMSVIQHMCSCLCNSLLRPPNRFTTMHVILAICMHCGVAQPRTCGHHASAYSGLRDGTTARYRTGCHYCLRVDRSWCQCCQLGLWIPRGAQIESSHFLATLCCLSRMAPALEPQIASSENALGADHPKLSSLLCCPYQ